MRECVDIRLEPAGSTGVATAAVSLRLADLGFPEDAKIVLEAYHRSSGMRFECGTVGQPTPSPLLQLNEIDGTASILFRLKVVDPASGSGRILGSADRIRPASNDDNEARRSIFPISERPLGHEVWRVDVDEAGPSLVLNSRVPGFKHRILESPLMQGVILPAAFRIVLEHLVADPTPDDNDEDDWRTLWLRYLKEEFAIDEDLRSLSSEEAREWVDSTVRQFCQTHEFVESIRTMNESVQ